jgi:micrococcal nuclease
MGFDTPETYRAKCESELAAGYEAKARLVALLTIERRGLDKYQRRLARLYVNDELVAVMMIEEGHARPHDRG